MDGSGFDSVMAGLVPAIRDFNLLKPLPAVDGRHKVQPAMTVRQ